MGEQFDKDNAVIYDEEDKGLKYVNGVACLDYSRFTALEQAESPMKCEGCATPIMARAYMDIGGKKGEKVGEFIGGKVGMIGAGLGAIASGEMLAVLALPVGEVIGKKIGKFVGYGIGWYKASGERLPQEREKRDELYEYGVQNNLY